MNFRLSSTVTFIVLGALVLFSYQNCAPVGNISNLSQSSKVDGQTPEENTSGTVNPEETGSEAPEPPTDSENPDLNPPADPAGCLSNQRPTLLGWRSNQNSGAYTLGDYNGSYVMGMGQSSGDDPPLDIYVGIDRHGDPNGQQHSFRCEITQIPADGNNQSLVQTSCGDAFGAGQNQAQFRLMKDQNQECRVGQVQIRIRVEDQCMDSGNNVSNQEFVFTVNVSSGCLPEEKLVMPNIQVANNNSGVGVDIDGNWVAMTSPEDDAAAANAGSVEVFSRSGNNATHAAKLVPDDISAGDADNSQLANSFLRSVAISGNYIAAGAPAHNNFEGAVYLYKYDSGSWSQIGRLTPPNSAAGSDTWFGYSLAMDGNILVIGAHYDREAGTRAGAAYVYERTGDSFSLRQKLQQGSDPGANRFFGFSVAVDNGVVAVGAPVREFNSTLGPGNAFVYSWNGTAYVEKSLALPSGLPDGAQFGYSIGISGNNVIVGAPRDAGGSFSDNGAGAAFVIDHTNDNITQLRGFQGRFGESVAIDGNKVVIGAIDTSSRQGAASYHDLSNLDQNANKDFEIRARDRRNRDEFGKAVAVDGDHAVIGSWLDTVNQNSINRDKAGSAYLLELDPPNPWNFGDN